MDQWEFDIPTIELGQKGVSVFIKITQMVLFGYKSYSSKAGSSDQEGRISL